MIKVRPQVGAPNYYDVQFGWLLVWVLANTRKEAAKRAGPSVLEARCEIADSSVVPLREDQFPAVGDKFDVCKRAGLAGRANSYAIWRPIGSVENDELFNDLLAFPELEGVTLPSPSDVPSD